jgi:hypothetical protein
MPFKDKEKEKEYKKQYYLKNKCEHGRHKSQCRDCGGSAVCPHQKARNICKECGGASICQHNRRRSKCKECGGASICIHMREKNQCKECGGSSICEHNRQRKACKDCNGVSICEHQVLRRVCKYCNLQTYLVHLQRSRIRKILNNNDLQKTKSTIEYLDCSPEYFIEFLRSKLIEGMTFDNIHIDHIKPVSAFKLDDPEEFLKCCHYTNMQPLLITDNLEKSNKWTEENERYWNDNIIYKEHKQIYYTKNCN